MADTRSILWVDDEIETLKPHLLFLEDKGYTVTPVSNGDDAVALVKSRAFDLVLLDENMPGKDGLQTLQEIRHVAPNVPIVMVTRNEAEEIMDQAIGRRADDYLLKPVNPTQILAAIRRILDRHRITESQVAKDYVQQYAALDTTTFGGLDHAGWIDTYLRIIDWDLRLDEYRNTGLNETHEDQKHAANFEFSRYVVRHYKDWVQRKGSGPELSPDVFKNHVFPAVQSGKRVAFIIVDCMRLDQWMMMEPLIDPYFRVERKQYYSILPTATPYSRNALFAGLFPLEIQRKHPTLWEMRDEGSLNRHERELLELQLKRLGAGSDVKVKYGKIYNPEDAVDIQKSLDRQNDANVYGLVFNFIDMLAHGRSESRILQEMSPDEAAFRSVARSWFQHSALFDILKKMAHHGIEVYVTTDHGAVLGKRPTIATGNRDTSTNVRYKFGENLGYDEKGAFKMAEPEDFMLPKLRSTMNYIIAKENFYFVYPTKYRQYERQFFGSFQHGGVSLEEMLLPIVRLVPRA